MEDRKQVKNVIFVDTKPIEEILERLSIPKDLYNWFETQKSRIILNDNGNNSTVINEIRNYIGEDEVKTASYLATPSAYFSCILKYKEIVQLFFLEKPWNEILTKFSNCRK